MKKSLISAAAALMLCACTSPNRYVIEGNVAGLEGTVYLFDRNQNLLDSAVVNAGAFRLKGTVEEPDRCFLADSSDPQQQVHAFAMPFFLEPGTIVIARAEDEEALPVVSGTPSNDAFAAFNAANKALIEEYRDPETTDERREAIEEEYDKLTEETYAANVGNRFGVMLLQQKSYELSGQELLDEIAKFPEALQAGETLTALKEQAELKCKTAVGKSYIDFAQPDADGAEVTLKSVVENPANKYTLLDFWASWCGPCMAEVPALKKAYDAYHQKGFEIFGVSLDNSKERWQQAIESKKLNWPHVSDLQGWQNAAAAEYGVRAIPANYLIDAQGVIVATNLRGEELIEKLKELLD